MSIENNVANWVKNHKKRTNVSELRIFFTILISREDWPFNLDCVPKFKDMTLIEYSLDGFLNQ